MTRLYVSTDPGIYDQLWLCDDCAVRVEATWRPSRLLAPPGADCDACGASQEVTEPFARALKTEKDQTP
jgi:hypothetical protein